MKITLTQKKLGEGAVKIVFLVAAAFSVLAAVAIIIFLLAKGIPAFGKIGIFEMLFGTTWKPNPSDTLTGEVAGTYGILPMIVGTLSATAGALLVGGILGYFTAVFLACFCPKKLKSALMQVVNLLAGIPSVVFGFFVMQVLLPALGVFSANGSGSGLAAVSLILGLMISPTIIALSVSSIDAVSSSIYEGARALGETHAGAVFSAVVPSAKSGIAASFILGIGRALGETMAVIMIAGNNPVFAKGLFRSFRTLTANVVLEMGYAGELQMGALFATGCVLLFFTLVVTLIFKLMTADKRTSKVTKHSVLHNLLKMRYKVLTKIKLALAYAMSAVTVLALVFIVVFLLVKGIPNITTELLFGTFAFGGSPTIASSVVSTLMLVALSIVVAVPLGVAAAIYLTEYTKRDSKLTGVIRTGIEVLSGIPSIVYGLFGMLFFSGILGFGTSILAGSLTITLMIIPVIIRGTEEALKAVPDSYREGSYALGAGKLRTIFRVVLPSAFAGIMASVLLSVGRVVSESAPLMLTMGASMQKMPEDLSSSGTSLAVCLYVLSGEGLHIGSAYATACVLLFIVLVINLASTLLTGKLHKKQVNT
jgi:phosphate transport system permease protein